MIGWRWGARAVAILALSTPALANQNVIQVSRDPANWAIQSGDYAGTRYSKLDQITTANVGDLKVAWTFSTGVLRGHEGAPLVIGNVMYVHTPFPNTVMALDLNDEQKIIWKYEPKQDPTVISVMCCDTVSRGVQYAEGKILLHTADTSLIALDAKTGKELWKVVDGDPKLGATGTGAPLIAKDKVIVGVSGGEFGVRCYLTAYDMNSGNKVWRAYSMGPDSDILVDPEKTTSLGKPVGENSSLNSWNGDQWKIGGGPTWGYMAYDPEFNLIYYGTGNPSTWNPVQRSGPDSKPIDQKWAMTMFARDVDTGVAKWVYQMTPFDQWDYDGINEPILADLEINGVMRKTATHFDRNGFGYTWDRVTGELLVAEKFDPTVNWASGIDMDKSSPTYGRPKLVEKYEPFKTGVDDATKGICPSSLGAKNQQPASYSKLTGLFYVPTNHVCMDYEPFKVRYTAGQPYVGATLTMYPAPDTPDLGNFIAWDGAKGKIVWSKPERFSVWSGALTTAGGVAFYGTLEGYFKAVDQKDGKELFKFKTPSGIVGNAMTYMRGGKQYVAVYSGVGGWAGIGLAAGLRDPEDGSGAVGGFASLSSYTSTGGSLTVFSLP
ncbi:methanol/ethanol family PQQ-dependent dehydrogenase [Hyphomicrobium denitrificans 1NES1]|uniref:Methanol/ethanol family PQQ-dependent dehydrogenase n=1 Tax=Hyphomicrobium denitrificans 1NES1 TaxID=670307 RepID=N0B6K2_9HYPH|nr:methanol/ethanol family PQQ-dependent dehydrogenase [Hyphomicrobium denitrificans]AGK59229.1 methanol/ethanol family PQQ-dependent dehydrogenase [Hyphomicrobium denitrificans 1NES1]